jgi:hypothetical protein
LTGEELLGNGEYCGLVERYLNLQPHERPFLFHDIRFVDGIRRAIVIANFSQWPMPLIGRQ